MLPAVVQEDVDFEKHPVMCIIVGFVLVHVVLCYDSVVIFRSYSSRKLDQGEEE
jgi:hypothetical protein